MPKRAEQTEIPMAGKGVAPVNIKAINNAMRKYIEIRDERMALTKKEVDAKAVLLDRVKEHADEIGQNEKGEIIYRWSDQMVVVKSKGEDVKVKTITENDLGSGGDEPKDPSEIGDIPGNN